MAGQKDACLTFRLDPVQGWVIKMEGHRINGTAQVFDYDDAGELEMVWNLFATKVTCSFCGEKAAMKKTAMLLLAFFLSGISAAQAGSVIIIASRDVPSASLSHDELQRIFLGKMTAWPDGKKIVPVYLKGGTKHAFFLRSYLDMNPSQLRIFNAAAPVVYEQMRKAAAEYDPATIEKAEDLARQRTALHEDLRRYRDHFSSELNNELGEVGSSIRQQGVLSILIFVLAVGLSLVIVVFMVVRFIRAPLDNIINAFNLGTAGDFSRRLDESSPDEFGRLSHFFNTFMEKLDLYNRDLHAEIMEHKRAVEALRRSEELYSRLVTTIPDFIVQTSHDGTIVFVNDQALKLSGYTREELVGSNMLQFIAPEDRDRALENNLLMQHDRLGPQEYDLIMRDGRRVSFEVNGDTLRNPDGTPSGSVFLCRDITQRKLAEQEMNEFHARLTQAQKMESIGTLAGGIAHDFNNILSSVLGYAGLAKMRLESKEDVRNDIDEIMKAGIRARDLVKQILTFSRQADIQQKPVLVAPLIKETMKFLRASLPATIEIRLDIGAPGRAVMADPTHIHQVIMNLCTNAHHAMKEKGGVIDIRLKEVMLQDSTDVNLKGLKNGRYLKLSISDTGYGIPPEILDRIFDPFFTTKEQGEGTGLGLSVVHGIVKDMEGAIAVSSEPLQGTIFDIYLPVCDEGAAEDETGPPALRKGRGRILFVDDEKHVLASGRGILERLGYEVVPTAGALEALEIFRSRAHEFDLVLTDMTMPNMTGLDLSANLRQIRSDIPIILCTGYDAGIPEERLRKVGIRETVKKPMIPSELADVVFNALNRGRQIL